MIAPVVGADLHTVVLTGSEFGRVLVLISTNFANGAAIHLDGVARDFRTIRVGGRPGKADTPTVAGTTKVLDANTIGALWRPEGNDLLRVL